MTDLLLQFIALNGDFFAPPLRPQTEELHIIIAPGFFLGRTKGNLILDVLILFGTLVLRFLVPVVRFFFGAPHPDQSNETKDQPPL